VCPRRIPPDSRRPEIGMSGLMSRVACFIGIIVIPRLLSPPAFDILGDAIKD
jgi:hypothetical protein